MNGEEGGGRRETAGTRGACLRISTNTGFCEYCIGQHRQWYRLFSNQVAMGEGIAKIDR